MIVLKTDNIPNQKIIKVLGKVKTRLFAEPCESTEIAAKEKLKRKAKALGADAIINFDYKCWGFPETLVTVYRGLAVKTDFTFPIQQALNTDVCWNCGTKINKDQLYCRVCFAKNREIV